MSMGYAAANVYVVAEEKLKQQFPEELNRLYDAIAKAGGTLEEFAATVQHEGPLDETIEDVTPKQEDEIYAAYDAFQKAFKDAFDMLIEIGYHNNEDEGSDYDDVDGAFFALDHSELYQLTPNANRLNESLGFEQQSFVVFG